MSFLFAESMAKRAIKITNMAYSYNGDYNHFVKQKKILEDTLETYDFYCHSYFGLGLLFSLFIPTTKAHEARLNLTKQAKDYSELLLNHCLNEQSKLSNTKKYQHRAYLKGFFWGGIVNTIFYIPDIPTDISIKVSEIFQSSDDNFFTKHNRPTYNENFVSTLKFLFSRFPIISNFVRYRENRYNLSATLELQNNSVSNLFHTLCNPVRLISDTLSFIERILYAILNLSSGSAIDPNVKFPPEKNRARLALKVFVSTAALIIKFPVNLVSAITDLPYQFLLKEPFEFITESIIQSIEKIRGLIKKEPVIVKNSHLETLKALNKHIAEQPGKLLISSVENIPSCLFLQLPHMNLGESDIYPISKDASVCPLSPRSAPRMQRLVGIIQQPGCSMKNMADAVEVMKEEINAASYKK